MLRDTKNLFILIFTTLILVACASTPEDRYADIAPQEDEQSSDPKQLVEQTAALFTRPENLGLEFYSPSYYESAVQALEDAEDALTNAQQSKVSPIRASVAARKLLERAQENRDKVERNLRELVKHRNLLLELEAPKWQPADWKSVSKEIKALMILIEEDEIRLAVSKEPAVREIMYQLEIDTLLSSSLNDAREMLEKADQEQAERYAPKLFNSADILIDDTVIFIKGNFRDRKGIAERAELARLEAERAFKTALDGQMLFDFSEEDAEQYLSALKNQLDKISLALSEQALPPATLNEAISELIDMAEQTEVKEEAELTVADTPEPDLANNTDADIQVLEVLNSLDLSLDNEARSFESEKTTEPESLTNNPFFEEDATEQQFDSVEIVE